MSLRYELPPMTAKLVPQENLIHPPVHKPPVDIEFRRNADMARLAREILAHPSVRVIAAVASGKSVKLPSALAMTSKKLVIHVVPGRNLAIDLYNYVAKCANDAPHNFPPLTRFVRSTDELPKSGVYYCASAELISLMGERPVHSKPLTGTILYIDEAHESGAYIHLLRTLGRSLGAENVILSSATFGASNFRGRETEGKVEMHEFAAEEVPETWNVSSGPNRPWSIRTMRGNIVIFTDSGKQVASLTQKYQDAGLPVYHVTARMPEDRFLQAMRAMRDPKGSLIVLIMDSSHRSGFSLDYGVAIDTGKVAFIDATDNDVVKRNRSMFESESYQTANRGARTRNEVVQYWRPAFKYLNAIVDLDGVEKEAAALLYRCFGYRPNGPLEDAVMATRDIKVDVWTALVGMSPLRNYPAIKAQYNCKFDETKVDRLPSYQESSMRDVQADNLSLVSDKSSSAASSEPKSVGKSSLTETLGSVVDTGEVPEEVEQTNPASIETDSMKKLFSVLYNKSGYDWNEGRYYTLAEFGEINFPRRSLAFPNGVDSVRSMFSLSTCYDPRALDPVKRLLAIKILCDRYNLLNVELSAFVKALNQVLKRYKAVRVFHSTRKFLIERLEKASGYEHERSELLAVMAKLVDNGYNVREAEIPVDIIAERAVQMVTDFDSCMHQGEFATDHQFATELRDNVARMSNSRLDLGRYKGELDYYDDDRVRVSASSEELLRIDMPSWSGFKEVTYSRETKYRSDGSVRREWNRVEAKTGTLVRVLTGKKYYSGVI